MRVVLYVLVLVFTAITASSYCLAESLGPVPDSENEKRRIVTFSEALILGIVEGLTEYVPVSSTAHLLLTQRVLKLGQSAADKAAADAYAICIQGGAILAVLLLYAGRVKRLFLGLIFGTDKQGRQLALKLLIAFSPSAACALLFEDKIKVYLFGLWPIVVAWFIGGLVILRYARISDRQQKGALEDLTYQQAVIVGVIQCCALWPGVSRSLATILGGVFVGLSAQAAVEFSFLLGILTLGAATGYEMVFHGQDIIASYSLANAFAGIVAAFFAAVVSVKWMVNYLSRYSLAIFGYYRILMALIVAGCLLGKVL